jgi:hypothetical protein
MSDAPNPFAAPQSHTEPPRGQGFRGTPGELDGQLAIKEGWNACWSHFGPWLGVGIVGSLVGGISVVTVVGIFLVLPLLLYGGIKFSLNTIDGYAEFSDLFSGFKDYSHNLGQMLVGFLLAIAIFMPASLVQNIFVAISPIGGMFFGLIVNVLFSYFVTVRLFCWFFYMVDQDMNAMDALKASWAATEGKNGAIFTFFILQYLVIIAGLFALGIGVIPATFITYGAMASAYRQLSGTTAPVQSSL